MKALYILFHFFFLSIAKHNIIIFLISKFLYIIKNKIFASYIESRSCNGEHIFFCFLFLFAAAASLLSSAGVITIGP